MFYIRNKAFLDKNGLSLFGMIEVLKELGFEADALKGSFFELEKELKNIQLPFIALVTNDNYENHYVVVEKINDKVIKIFDPAKGETKLTAQQFIEIWSGYIVIVSKSNTRDEKIQINGKKNKYFNIIKKNWTYFLCAMVFSILFSLLTIFSSVLYQKIIDEYILGGGSNSLVVNHELAGEFNRVLLNGDKIFFALFITYIVKTIIYLFRAVLFAVLEKKVDIQLKNLFIDKYLRLPMRFLNDRDTGEIMNRYDSISVITNTLVGAGISIILEFFVLITASIVLLKISEMVLEYK